jgi:transcriptional regulator with XRE-family HTH domain
MPMNETFHTNYEYAQTVCARLRAFRKDAGLTASEVAEHLNIPTSLYVLYEEYQLVPHQALPPLCELLNMSPWHYLTGMSDALSPPFQQSQRTLE